MKTEKEGKGGKEMRGKTGRKSGSRAVALQKRPLRKAGTTNAKARKDYGETGIGL
jgi:hypothetical protein